MPVLDGQAADAHRVHPEGPMPVQYKAAIARNLEKHIWPFIGRGQIKPVIYRKLPMEQAAEAHAIMESSAHIGKILLTAE